MSTVNLKYLIRIRPIIKVKFRKISSKNNKILIQKSQTIIKNRLPIITNRCLQRLHHPEQTQNYKRHHHQHHHHWTQLLALEARYPHLGSYQFHHIFFFVFLYFTTINDNRYSLRIGATVTDVDNPSALIAKAASSVVAAQLTSTEIENNNINKNITDLV